jgi:hypothetical protein
MVIHPFASVDDYLISNKINIFKDVCCITCSMNVQNVTGYLLKYIALTPIFTVFHPFASVDDYLISNKINIFKGMFMLALPPQTKHKKTTCVVVKARYSVI